MTKTINVDDETWSRLTILKAKHMQSDLDSVLRMVLDKFEEK